MACDSKYSKAIGRMAAGRIGEEEAKELLDHLELCSQCSEEFDLAAGLVASSATVRPMPRSFLYAAAMVLIAGSLWWLLSLNNNSVNSLARITPLPVAQTVLRANTLSEAAPSFKKAMEFYAQKDYANAEKMLSRTAEKTPDHPLTFLYLGIAQLMLKKETEAILSLKRAAAFGENLIQERALWYLGNAYLVLENSGDALETFMELQRLEGDYEPNAREIMTDIRETTK